MRLRLTFLLLVLAAAFAAAPPASAQSAEEMRCQTLVEGKVAWNRGGDTIWNPANIEALCAGTTDAAARIACFEAGIAAHDDWSRAIQECAAASDGPVEQALPAAPSQTSQDEVARCRTMIEGQVAWEQGGNTAWNPDNINSLCEGTTDAEARIACFEAGIAAHNDWARAIQECKSSGDTAAPAGEPQKPSPAETAETPAQSGEIGRADESGLCKDMIQGEVPMQLPNGSKTWPAELLGRLCDGTPNAIETLKCFLKTLYNDGGAQPSTEAAVEFCRWK